MSKLLVTVVEMCYLCVCIRSEVVENVLCCLVINTGILTIFLMMSSSLYSCANTTSVEGGVIVMRCVCEDSCSVRILDI